MRTFDTTVEGPDVDFIAARKSANQIASRHMMEPFLISWYDGATRTGHPDVPECTGKPGWLTYGESRGGCLTVNVNEGRFGLIYTEISQNTPNQAL